MKRTGFSPKPYQRQPKAPLVPVTSCNTGPVEREPVRISKEVPLQHEGYFNLVRAMPCAHCGRAPRSQFCHADMGKGAGLKTDCRRGWPGCGDDPRSGREGCHTLIGSRGVFTKEQRRALEDRYAAQTRAAIVAAGLWPARLPRWPE